MSRYVIVGCGAAGNAAAETIRKIDADSEIRMFTKEANYYYYRPALPDYLAGEKTLKGFTLHDAAWYGKNRVEVHLSTEVIRIDPAARTIATQNGETFVYDRLLLATGGNATVPAVKGVENDGVFTLRNLADADAIRRRAATAKSLVLIGGGLLSLEAGHGLLKLGLKVTVIERNVRLLPRQMDPAGAQLLQRKMEEMGLFFELGEQTREITRQNGGLAILLESGKSLEADMVLLSAGVTPELTLAKALGLTIGRGVQVDDRLRTSIEDIFAAGDLIEHRGRYYGSWPAAMAQGRVAGANMAGQETLYEGTVFTNKLKVAGIDLVSMGNIDAAGKEKCLITTDDKQSVYRKLVVAENRLDGAILYGNVHGEKAIYGAIEEHKDVSAAKKVIEEEGFDLSTL
ncbi:MAG TPA: FAD-dependent oxidoreductase [Syntrophales bacterium]|nr:FAD-dependent oxidoreductase [Syntrophales bacterium]